MLDFSSQISYGTANTVTAQETPSSRLFWPLARSASTFAHFLATKKDKIESKK